MAVQDAEERQSEALEIALLNRSIKQRGGSGSGMAYDMDDPDGKLIAWQPTLPINQLGVACFCGTCLPARGTPHFRPAACLISFTRLTLRPFQQQPVFPLAAPCVLRTTHHWSRPPAQFVDQPARLPPLPHSPRTRWPRPGRRRAPAGQVPAAGGAVGHRALWAGRPCSAAGDRGG